MKITITQIVLEFDQYAEPQMAPNPTDTRPRNDNFLAGLFFDLLREEPDSPQKTWEADPHGPFFKV